MERGWEMVKFERVKGRWGGEVGEGEKFRSIEIGEKRFFEGEMDNE